MYRIRHTNIIAITGILIPHHHHLHHDPNVKSRLIIRGMASTEGYSDYNIINACNGAFCDIVAFQYGRALVRVGSTYMLLRRLGPSTKCPYLRLYRYGYSLLTFSSHTLKPPFDHLDPHLPPNPSSPALLLVALRLAWLTSRPGPPRLIHTS